MKNKAFVTIEILIAMVIGFLAILMLTVSIKSLHKVEMQKKMYQNLYITVLSLKDKIRAKTCIENSLLNGKQNGFNYNITCQEKKNINNYKSYYDEIQNKMVGGYWGIYEIHLFRVTINIKKDGLNKKYSFYQTEQKARFTDEELLQQMLDGMR